MPLATDIAIIVLLILANGFFSMTEFALISAKKSRLQKKAEDGDAGAATALNLAEDPTQFLSTVQVGITVIGILSGAFGGATLAGPLAEVFTGIPLVAPYSGPLAVVIVVAVITYLTLVIGELVPKRVAMNNAERIASLVSRPIRLLSLAAAPLVRVLTASTEAILMVLGVRKPSGPEVTEEDVRVLIGQATQAGVFQEAEQDMVESVFRLADRRVSVLMTPRPDIVAVDVEDSLEENWQMMVASGHIYFPVFREHLDNLLGIVSVRDLWARMIAGETPDLTKAIKPALFVPESVPALSVLDEFKTTRARIALVTDEYGSIQGLVTIHDIMESIVGGIPSTGEVPEGQVVRREDGSWLLDGMLPVDELHDLIGTDTLPGEGHGYYQTLGGFVMMYLERTPKTGDRFTWKNLQFEVLDMDGYRVDKVLIMPLAAGEEKSE
ncbi:MULTISPECIES: hemolysin family protein [unclassified Methanoculleus]|uniref:hemolysin family protein n=1 Tax=unclassified Methanoculleus TaxID=2619537 RepID=UPI00260086DE|nr:MULTISPECIES: hemolysin family protein [unclassified Methanoculleus]MCK9317087.1 hemolysin family protein [Methanoculleus sp.]MDD2253422.1 hemolysin family protein [Methanoculleus sp.]MDD2787172.1 hemolysin family protein [Methanoculleus sp.]MDD3214999.1 hemolysin family protein [Methanoculleus sp.]MDD4313973.1 hemolysin family protein [Methanoculleus sp.]